MLKSLSTQFAATLFFGPFGLAYSSMAAAVFLTLILAVLYFTGLGILAMGLIWPASIMAGLIFVKMHNDQIRSSGSTLLLGPDEEEAGVSTLNSWGRGVAVLSLLGVIGYLAIWYIPANKKSDQYASERSVTRTPADDTLVGSVSSDSGALKSSSSSSSSSDSLPGSGDNSELAIAKTYPLEPDAGQSGSDWGSSSSRASVSSVFGSRASDSGASGSRASVSGASGSRASVSSASGSRASVSGASDSRASVSSASSSSASGSRVSDSSASGSASSGQSAGDLRVVTFEEQRVQRVVIGTSSQPDVSVNRLYVQSELVNLREGPGANFSILTTVERGEELAEIDRSGSWIQIRTAKSGATGWIFNRLVSTQR